MPSACKIYALPLTSDKEGPACPQPSGGLHGTLKLHGMAVPALICKLEAKPFPNADNDITPEGRPIF